MEFTSKSKTELANYLPSAYDRLACLTFVSSLVIAQRKMLVIQQKFEPDNQKECFKKKNLGN